MRNLKKTLMQLLKIEKIYSDNYVISQSEKEWKKWKIINKTRKYFVEECNKNGFNHWDILKGKETKK